MQNFQISSRAKKILLRICQESEYVTISAIAKDLGVSAKTVLRELDEVERWLDNQGCSLKKKTGAGIKISVGANSKLEIETLLSDTKAESVFTPQERQTILISELLQNQEPVKLYNFAVMLKVTEGTVSNDLDKSETWFVANHLILIRKPGLGVYVEGREENFRKAMIQFIYENVDEDQLLKLIRSNLTDQIPEAPAIEIEIRKRLLNLVDQEVIRKLETAIREAETQMGYKLADSAYVGLIVHLALAVQRIRKNEEITINPEFLAQLKQYPEYVVATEMGGALADHFSVTVPEDEIGYITMHLKGAKNREEANSPAGKMLGSFQLVKLAKEMIKLAEEATGCHLAQNENLLIGLVNHLGPSIVRLTMNMDIRNPLLENIKALYPEFIEISRKCAQVVEKQVGVTMPESEIAYIAMHLGAAIENCGKQTKLIYRCAIACATGIGTSRLLVTRIAKEYENIEIVDTISTLYIKEKWLQERNVDFIISTVSIDQCVLPVVTVNPLLFEVDKIKINRQLAALKGRIQYTVKSPGNHRQLPEKLLLLKDYNRAISEVLEQFFLLEGFDSPTVDDLIVLVGNELEPDIEKRQQLISSLREREEKGGTLITGHQLVLIHCRTIAVQQLRFGAIKIRPGITMINGQGETEPITLGIILLAPAHCSEADMETASHVSRMIIERPRFAQVLRDGERDDAWRELCNLMEEFYRQRHNKIMEG